MTIISWFNQEFWGPVWPNLAASAVCTTMGVLRIRIHLARHHEAQVQQHAATREMVAALNARLDAIAPAGGNTSPGRNG